MLIHFAWMAAGVVALVAGADALVRGASKLALSLGISPLVVGLTVVAFGTSSPEMAVSVQAARSGEVAIALGNAVGSNIFNLLAILGATALVRPIGVPEEVLVFDLPLMLAVAAACLPVFFTGGRIARWEGWVFVGYYVAYVVYLVLDATRHDALPTYTTMMLVFVLPLTVLTFAVLVARQTRRSG